MAWYLLAGRVRQVKSAQFMAIAYTDEEIVKLIQERKVLPNDWRLNDIWKPISDSGQICFHPPRILCL
jgi:hypothetical protein